MKRTILFAGALLALVAAAAVIAGQVDSIQIIQTNASTTAPVRLSSNHVYFASMTIVGNKAARTANTGTVYVGPTSGDDTQSIPITTGQTVTFVVPQGQKIDLYNWWLDPATAGDGVVIIYTPVQ